MGLFRRLISAAENVMERKNSPPGLMKLTDKEGRRLVYLITDGRKATKSLRKKGLDVESLVPYKGEVIKLPYSEHLSEEYFSKEHLVSNRREIKTWEKLEVEGPLEEDLSPIRSFSGDGMYLIMDYVRPYSGLKKNKRKKKVRSFSSNLNERLVEDAEALGISRNDIDVNINNAGWHPELGPVIFDYPLLPLNKNS